MKLDWSAMAFTVRAKKLRAWVACFALCAAVSSPAQDSIVPSSSTDNNRTQAPVSPPASPQAPIQAPDYLIGTDDVLDVYIVDVPELSRQYRVSGGGTVTVPMLSTPVKAAGLTLSQFSEALTNDLKTAGLVSDPHVNTSVNQSRLHAVAITGSVKRPQVYSVFSQTTLLDMLSQAEGLADDAGGVAIISRGDIAAHALAAKDDKSSGELPESQRTITLDLKQLLESGDPKLNLDIYPGDRITIPRAGVVYAVGAVNKPGGFTMRPNAGGMTVLQLLALAEDTKPTAKRGETVIIRNDAQSPGGRKQIPADLKNILQGKLPDPVLQPDDILFIPDSAGKRAFRRGLEAVVQTTTGLAIYGSRF
jgi:polysaccharide export outer membrane protein